MRIGRCGRVFPVCGNPAQVEPGGREVWSITGKCEEKPMAGSVHPLPNGDMRVKHLCKGNVPLLLQFFLQNGLTTTRMTMAISTNMGNSLTARKKRAVCGCTSAANCLRQWPRQR